jgi:hypothetical protein
MSEQPLARAAMSARGFERARVAGVRLELSAVTLSERERGFERAQL